MKKKLMTKRQEDALSRLLDIYPIDLTEPKETNMAMRESLAHMYADPAMRSFLENAIRYANRSLIASTLPEQHVFYKSRIETLLQLLSMGKQHFIHFEMKRAATSKEPLRAVEHLVEEIKL